MFTRIRYSDGAVIVEIEGPIDARHLPRHVNNAARRVIAPVVLLDLSKAQIAGTDELNAIAAARQIVRERGGELELLGLTANCGDVLVIVALATAYTVHSVEETVRVNRQVVSFPGLRTAGVR
jgi:anti-anti-sigma regulatory factor